MDRRPARRRRARGRVRHLRPPDRVRHARSETGRCISRSAPSTTRLPAIGHACGHNIIAATAVGAGLALAPLVDELGLTVTVIGTPAEEGGGGKVLLLERGAFDGVHAAMMVHPAPLEDMTPRISAVAHFRVQYTGHESHAAAAPAARDQRRSTRSPSPRSRSGCCASISGQANRSTASSRTAATRQRRPRPHRGARGWHAPRTDDRPRASSSRASTSASRRARSPPARRSTIERRRARLLAHGARSRAGRALPRQRARHSAAPEPLDDAMTFSTDMGNVSLAMPSIHPMHRDRHRRRGQPSAGVRGGVHQRVGRSGCPRRIACACVDRDRHRDRLGTRPAARALTASRHRPRPRSRRSVRCPSAAVRPSLQRQGPRRRQQLRARPPPGRGRPGT